MTYEEFLDKLSKPAMRALLAEGIDSFEILAEYSDKALLDLHGLGPKSMPIIHEALEKY